MEEPTTLELLFALYLIQYYRYSLSVRMHGMFASGGFDTPEVRELLNLVMWMGNGMPINMRINHASGLHNIVTRNAKDVKEKMERIAVGNVSTHALETVNELNLEIIAADTLMEYLTNG